MTKRTLIATSAAMLAFSGLPLFGFGIVAAPGIARALPCSNDVTDVD